MKKEESKWKHMRKVKPDQGLDENTMKGTFEQYRIDEDRSQTKTVLKKRGLEDQVMWSIKTYETKTKGRTVNLEKEVRLDLKNNQGTCVKESLTRPVVHVKL